MRKLLCAMVALLCLLSLPLQVLAQAAGEGDASLPPVDAPEPASSVSELPESAPPPDTPEEPGGARPADETDAPVGSDAAWATPAADNTFWQQAAALSAGQPSTQTLEAAYDARWYRFTLPGAGTWKLLFACQANSSTQGWWVDVFTAPDGVKSDASAYQSYFLPSAALQFESALFTDVAGAIYYICVSAPFANWSAAEFSLTAFFEGDKPPEETGGNSQSDGGTPDPAREREPNNTASAANPLVLGQGVDGVLQDYEDVDWFVFTLPQPGVMTLGLQNAELESDGSWVVQLFTESGLAPPESPFYAEERSPQAQTLQGRVALAAGRYYIKIQAIFLTGLRYKLQVDFLAEPGWEMEPNDRFEAANTLAPSQAAKGTSSSATDYDWFTFEFGAQGELSFVVEGGSAGQPGGWVAELYPADGEGCGETPLQSGRFACGAAGGGVALALQPGRYYLRVRPDEADPPVWTVYTVSLGFRAFAPVTDVVMAQARIYLVKGKSATVGTVAYTADGTAAPLAWESSDAAVATVEADGKIRAHKTGSARISAIAENGEKCDLYVRVVAKAIEKIKIENLPGRVTAGKARFLTAAVSPATATGAKVKWKSNKPSVLAVDAAGRMRAKKVGTAKLTLTVGQKRLSAQVRVVAPVTKVRLPQKSLYLVQGKRLAMPAVAYTADGKKAKLVWKSSDPMVATVNKAGTVRAVAPGTAQITVAAENGKKAVMEVWVVTQAAALKSVSISGLPAQMAVGERSVLSAQLKPAGATGVRVKWKSSTPAVLSVDAAGVATARAPGQATITAVAGRRSKKMTVQVG